MKRYIGIDPGLSGGIATLSDAGSVLFVTKMPETERDVYDAILNAVGITSAVDGRAALEFVRSSPQQGVTSAFSFGRGYGGLRMALTVACVSFDEVTPQKWQKAMQCLTRGDKNVSKRRAQELFPHVKITHAIADALLLATYIRRVDRGELGR